MKYLILLFILFPFLSFAKIVPIHSAAFYPESLSSLRFYSTTTGLGIGYEVPLTQSKSKFFDNNKWINIVKGVGYPAVYGGAYLSEDKKFLLYSAITTNIYTGKRKGSGIGTKTFIRMDSDNKLNPSVLNMFYVFAKVPWLHIMKYDYTVVYVVTKSLEFKKGDDLSKLLPQHTKFDYRELKDYLALGVYYMPDTAKAMSFSFEASMDYFVFGFNFKFGDSLKYGKLNSEQNINE